MSNVIQSNIVERWEADLENLGPLVSIEELIAHESTAPPGAPSANWLRGFIAGQQFAALQASRERRAHRLSGTVPHDQSRPLDGHLPRTEM